LSWIKIGIAYNLVNVASKWIFYSVVDGLEEKDKDTLVDVLTEVAQLNVKDNKYTLQRQLYGEVMINCTLYSDDDRVLLTRYVYI